MDLGAYVNIENLDHIMAENGISIPRLRGLRLMVNEQPLTKEEIEKQAKFNAIYECETLCAKRFMPNRLSHEFSDVTRGFMKKYLIPGKEDDDWYYSDVNWKTVHGKKRKMFKYIIKKEKKLVYEQYAKYNSYCGQKDVLYIHARIGGSNWLYYGGDEIEKQPWFIEKIDDSFDCTYCDIYARINIK